MSIIQVIAFLAGITMGVAALVIVCWVWLQRQTFAFGGAALSLIGLLLIGLSLWQTIHLKYKDTDIELKLSEVRQVVEAAKSFDKGSFDPNSKSDGYILLTCPASPTGLGVCVALGNYIDNNIQKIMDYFSITNEEAKKILAKPVRVSTSKDLVKDLDPAVAEKIVKSTTGISIKDIETGGIFGGQNSLLRRPFG